MSNINLMSRICNIGINKGRIIIFTGLNKRTDRLKKDWKGIRSKVRAR